MIINCCIIGAGGAIGAVLRYLLSLSSIQGRGGFPFATLLTNILGAFLIGLIAGAAVHGHQIDDRLSLFLRVGVCGGFTTFSTFALESSNMMLSGKTLLAAVYMICSIALSVLAVFAGEMITA